MKNKITETIKTIFVALALATGFAGLTPAQPPALRDFQPAVEKYHQQSKLNPSKNPKNLSVKSINASVVNRTNFSIGSEFVLVNLYAMVLDKDQNAPEKLIVELTHLIDLLENQPEAAMLQKALKSVIRKTANSAQVVSEVGNASNAYFNRQSSEQKWHFAAGYTVMNLAVNTYVGDDALTKNGLTEVQKLVATAPPGTSAKVLASLNGLVNYLAKTNYSENDYKAIFEGVVGVIGAVNA